MCVPRGATFAGLLEQPETLPGWLGEDDLEFYVAELERGGMSAPLNYYKNAEVDWEVLGQYDGRPVTVPSLFIGGDRDVATIWSQEAIARAGEAILDLRGTIILADCGHWIMQEQPDAVNAALVTFLDGL